MRRITVFAVGIVTLPLLAGCSSISPYFPTWMGGTMGETPAAQTSSATGTDPEVAAVQEMGARVRRNISDASTHNVDTRAALGYQIKGDQALEGGRWALAAEDYGRSRQALITSETTASDELKDRESQLGARAVATNPSEPSSELHAANPPVHHYVRPKERAEAMANHVRAQFYASAQGLSSGEIALARHHQDAGDQAVDTGDYHFALRQYRAAEHALQLAVARKHEADRLANRVRTQIYRTAANGGDLSKAQREEAAGDQELDSGHVHAAMEHYRMAEISIQSAEAGRSSLPSGTGAGAANAGGGGGAPNTANMKPATPPKTAAGR